MEKAYKNKWLEDTEYAEKIDVPASDDNEAYTEHRFNRQGGWTGLYVLRYYPSVKTGFAYRVLRTGQYVEMEERYANMLQSLIPEEVA